MYIAKFVTVHVASSVTCNDVHVHVIEFTIIHVHL